MRKINKKYMDIIIISILLIISIGSRFFTFTLMDKEENKDAYRDQEGIPYFHDMDSYYYSSLVKISLKKDNPFELFRTKNPYRYVYDEHKFQDIPSDRFVLLPFIVGILYRFISIFNSISINKFIAIITPILYSLAVIPAYIYVKKKTNVFGGISAGVITGLNASFMYYTGVSSFDTDVLLFLLPLVFIITFIESITNRKKVFYSILSYIFLILLLYTWNTSVVYVLLCLAIGAIILLIDVIKNRFNIKKIFKKDKVLIINVVVYILIYILLIGNIDIKVLIGAANSIGTSSAYPSAGLFVCELSKISILQNGIGGLFEITSDGIINRCGGIFACILVCYILFMMIYELLRTKSKNKVLIIALLVWFISTFISVFYGVRFFKLFIIPLMLVISLGIGNIYNRFKVDKKIIVFAITLTILLPYIQGFIVAMKQTPSANDVLYDASNWINNNTSDDAIIASWWDNGYYYEYKAERKVLSDGGTYNGRYYYFCSKALISTDINLTKAIFNMLASSGLEASYKMDEYFKDEKTGSMVLLEILTTDKENAINILRDKYNMDENKINEIINLTHKKIDNELLLVISSDMLKIMNAITYYGEYDFVNKENTGFYAVNVNSVIYNLASSNEYEGITHLKYFYNDDIEEGVNIWKIN